MREISEELLQDLAVVGKLGEDLSSAKMDGYSQYYYTAIRELAKYLLGELDTFEGPYYVPSAMDVHKENNHRETPLRIRNPEPLIIAGILTT